MIAIRRPLGLTGTPTLLFLATLHAPLQAGEIDGRQTGHAGSPRASAPLVIRGQTDVSIRSKRISNPDGPCIVIEDSVNVRLHNLQIGPCRSEGIRAKRVDGLSVTRSTITDTYKGIYALSSSRVRIVHNDFLGTHRNLVQFDKVNGPDSAIIRNLALSTPGNGRTEDLVNLYRSSGVSGSPIKVYYNHFRGGGRSRSGSGIMLGDNGGSHQIAYGNTLVDPGQVGIGVASGTNIRVARNRLFQGARVWSNVALYAWNQQPGSACGNVRVDRNEVTWKKADGQRYAWWSGGGCGDVRLIANDFDAGLTSAIFGN